MVEQAAYQQDLINDLTEAFSLEDIEEMEKDLLSYIEDVDSDIDYIKESESSNSVLTLLLMIHKKLLTKFYKFKTKWNKIINTPITFDKVKIGKQNINLIIIIFLLPLMLITINPLLMFIFEDTYWRFIIKYTTCYFIHQHPNIGYEALTEQLLEEMGYLYVELLLETYEETRIVIEQQMQHISNELNMIEATNNNQLIPEENNPNMNNTLNPDETVATSTPNTTSHELDVNTNSSISESLIPFLLIFIHHKLLIKINKIKTKWNKIITTPIILDKENRNRNIKSNNLKYIKLISIFVLFTSIMYISLLFYPSLLDNLNLSYLLLNITNITYYISDHLFSLYQYCIELYNIINFTDNTSKITNPEAKLINDYKDNSETIDSKDIIDSTPFYKSKTFMICGIIIISSSLIYLYFYNPTFIFGDSDESKLINRLLDTIAQKDNEINTLTNSNLQMLEDKANNLEQIIRINRRWRKANRDGLLRILEE
jgi:hypothetical protein